ncbi:hypothetical protein [uncultured Dietzia sp.]|uniref:hypothetical protein n=1 Tax=uncultured Dietzia sp. TaxID=395519 RepID=UPI0025E95A55|nr:hypothetical protein [uncultured Dietzia sp.]
MRNRVLLSAGAIALLAASCAQPEPQVLSEAPRSASAAELTSPSQTTEEEAQPGRFIARCATEADGGTPGMTFFTDGSQNVTDHCLSRYYIGVQPAPGALYVPDADAGSLAPTRENPVSETTDSYQWTPAQPRTDAGPEGVTDEDRDQLEGEETTSETDDPDSESTTPTPGETSPTTPPSTSPGPTDPTEPTQPGETTPGTGNPGETETSPTAPGSSEPGRPTEVPTTTGAQQSRPAAPPTSVESAGPTGPFGSLGSHGSHAPVPR